MTDLEADIAELDATFEKVQWTRKQTCEPKASTNPRHLALSNIDTNLRKAVGDMRPQL